jgi:hypothetical protein
VLHRGGVFGLLQRDAQALLRDRPSFEDHVRLHPEPGRRGGPAPIAALRSRAVPPRHPALPRKTWSSPSSASTVGTGLQTSVRRRASPQDIRRFPSVRDFASYSRLVAKSAQGRTVLQQRLASTASPRRCRSSLTSWDARSTSCSLATRHSTRSASSSRNGAEG